MREKQEKENPQNSPKNGGKGAEVSKTLFYMGFSLLSASSRVSPKEKRSTHETKTHLLCGWSHSVIQKNHLSVTIELFRHYCRKER